MFRLICLAIGYFIGCIQSAYVVGKFMRVDIRNYGSGNLGTTNALRVLGKRAGAVTFVCDVMKSFLSFLLCLWLFDSPMAGMYASLGAVLGHDFPFYLHFKGGKGIAVTIGLVFGLSIFVSPYFAACAYGFGIVGVLVSNTISLGSIFFVSMVPIVSLCLGEPAEMTVALLLMTALALYQHRANIDRLSHGKENKFFGKKKTAAPLPRGEKKLQ